VEGVRKQLAVGAIWTAGGRVVINLIGLASMLVLARLLTPEDFGLVAIATIVFAIINSFTELSCAAALIQHKDPQREHYDTAWTLNILRALLVSVALCISAHPAAAIYGDERLVAIMYVLGAVALSGGLANPRLVEFRRRLSFHQEIVIELAIRTIGFVVGATIAYVFRSYWALVIASLAGQATGLILSYVLIPFMPRPCLTHWRSLFSFSGWLVLSSGVSAINYRVDQLAIGAVLGKAPLGQYTVGDNLASLPVREATAPLVQVLFPAFARLQDDAIRRRDTYLRSQRLLVAAALPVGLGFAMVAAPLVQLALGPQWTSVALVIQILSVVFAVQAISTPLIPLAMGLGRTRLLFLRDLLNIAVRYPLVFLGLFSGGLPGLLIARCASGLFGIGLDLYLARRLTGAGMLSQVTSSWRAIAASGIMVASTLGLGATGIDHATFVDLAVLVVAGATSYLGATVLLWLAAGRPAGPEREVLGLLAFLYRRVAGAPGARLTE
jgi:O-antigen/teichoic acid export membrane protein